MIQLFSFSFPYYMFKINNDEKRSLQEETTFPSSLLSTSICLENSINVSVSIRINSAVRLNMRNTYPFPQESNYLIKIEANHSRNLIFNLHVLYIMIQTWAKCLPNILFQLVTFCILL